MSNLVLEKVYNTYKITGDDVWNNEIQPKIIELNQKNETFFSDTDFQENEQVDKELKDAKHKYKNSFNHFGYWMLVIFGLFFSFILVVPFYWALKKFKSMKSQKTDLLNKLEQAENNKLFFLVDKVSKLDLNEYFKEVNKITKFQNCGPIHESVTNYVKQNSVFNLTNNEYKNTGSTSWGIFDNNKIVINTQYSRYYMIEEKYTASRVVRIGESNVTVTGVVYMPKPIFEYNSSHWFFMKSCSNLELSLSKSYPKMNRILSFNKDVLLENKDFEKSFKWENSDPVQYRMIFTPYTQEYYVKNAFINKEFRQNYNLYKVKSFISNKLKASSLSLTNKLMHAIKNISTNLIDIDNIIKINAIDKIHSSYLRLTPGWILPILNSEDHSDILNEINNSKIVPNYSTFHYILNKLISQKIIVADTDTFNEIKSSFKLMSSYGNEIYGVEMEGLSFWARKKEKVVYSSGIPISVPYIEYIPTTARKYIFMTYLNNKWRHLWFYELINRWKNNNFSDEISPLIEKYKELGILISIDKTILTIMSDKLPKETIISIFDELIPIINKYN